MAYLRAYQAKGDPGVFGFIGKGLKKIAGVALGAAGVALPGVGVVGKIAKGALGGLKKLPGGKAGAIVAGGALAAGLGMGAAGEAALSGQFGGRKTYRRMNVTNVRALRRSMRRVTGFAKEARKVMTFTSHHKIKKTRKR